MPTTKTLMWIIIFFGVIIGFFVVPLLMGIALIGLETITGLERAPSIASMLIIIFAVVMTLGVVSFFTRLALIRLSQDETITGLERALGAKASITPGRFHRASNFTIRGSSGGKKVILSVVYADEIVNILYLRSPVAEVKVVVELSGEQLEKYGTGKRRMGLFGSVRAVSLGRAASGIHGGYLEMQRYFLFLPPTLKQLISLVKQTLKSVEKI